VAEHGYRGYENRISVRPFDENVEIIVSVC
jgi:hypothetical protein